MANKASRINREIEVRFLEINKAGLIQKLRALKARDFGQDLLREIIFYDPKKIWLKQKKMVRLREFGKTKLLTFKHTQSLKVTGTKELEIKIDDIGKAKQILENLGLVAFRVQEKKRHTFLLDKVSVDIDEHPKVPVYVEIEGPSEAALKKTAKLLGLDWATAHFESSRDFIEKIYKIPLTSLKVYTFNRVE
jgi:adenylate cyclase class 2